MIMSLIGYNQGSELKDDDFSREDVGKFLPLKADCLKRL